MENNLRDMDCWTIFRDGKVRARFVDEQDAIAFLNLAREEVLTQEDEGATEPRSEIREWLDARMVTLEDLLCGEQVRSEDLQTRLQYIINWAAKSGYLEDGTFTFPDGDTWEVA